MNQIQQEHQKLIDSLSSSLKERGYEILQMESKDYPQPEKFGRHTPDIIAKTDKGLIVIGEAKTSEDIASERSKEQYWDFSTRQMAEGLLRGQSVEFHIIVPRKVDLENLRKILYDLGLNVRIGKNIFLWYLKE